MKTHPIVIAAALWLTCCSACKKDLVEYARGDLKVSIEQGEDKLTPFLEAGAS